MTRLGLDRELGSVDYDCAVLNFISIIDAHNHSVNTMGCLRILPVFPFLLLVAFQPAAVLAKKRSVVVYQDPPTMDTVVTGDLKIYMYHAVLRTVKDGPIIGRLYGQTQFNEALFVNAEIETRARNLVFRVCRRQQEARAAGAGHRERRRVLRGRFVLPAGRQACDGACHGGLYGLVQGDRASDLDAAGRRGRSHAPLRGPAL
eukprot:evm.model.NODE_3093_length_2377_cov_12.354649.1